MWLGASCATGSQAAVATQQTTVAPSSIATTLAPDRPNVEGDTIVSGSVGDPDNPIGILEDGSTFDPEWKAHVTLDCGSDPDSRTISGFDARTNSRGNPVLYGLTPSGGGRALEPLEVNSIVPKDTTFAWAIDGILLGPWEVDSTTDTCDTTSSTALTATCAAPTPEIGVRPDRDTTVSIALLCATDDEIRMVERIVPTEPGSPEAVIQQLLSGVTPAEHAAGLRSSFSSYTAGQFHSVRVTGNNVVIVDFTSGFVGTNNFSTSHLSMTVFRQITESLLVDPDVSGIDFEVDSVRWCGWESGPCDAFPIPLISRG